MSINLEGLSLRELKKLEREVTLAIASYDTRAKAQALAELEAKARELGFSLAELIGAKVAIKGKRAAIPAKYANPSDPNETWSGRGRRPAWFSDAIASGKDASELLV